MTAEFDHHHGELDESAALCMEQIMEICAGAGSEWGPGEVMSAAVRLYFAVLTGGDGPVAFGRARENGRGQGARRRAVAQAALDGLAFSGRPATRGGVPAVRHGF